MSNLNKFLDSFRKGISLNRNKNKDVKAHSKRGTILDTNPPFAVIEAYKSLRYNIRFVLSTKNKNSFVISSPNMGDGKSTTLSNIAISIAQANERVLLIDMDLRRPSQHVLFKIENKVGISNIIGDRQDLKKAVHKDVIPNLDILTSGTIPPNPSEMVTSAKAKEIVEWAEENYDYVLIDAPPINVVSDALALADMTAGVILVVRIGSTHKDELQRAVENVQFVNSELLGVVLNSADSEAAKKQKMKRGYGYGYGYEYNYGSNYDKDENENKKENKDKTENSSEEVLNA